jgi:hypothetical protein
MKSYLLPLVAAAIALSGCSTKALGLAGVRTPAGMQVMSAMGPWGEAVSLKKLDIKAQRTQVSPPGKIVLGPGATTVKLVPADRADVELRLMSGKNNYVVTIWGMYFAPGATAAMQPSKVEELRVSYSEGETGVPTYVKSADVAAFLAEMLKMPGLTAAERERLALYTQLKRPAADAR